MAKNMHKPEGLILKEVYPKFQAENLEVNTIKSVNSKSFRWLGKQKHLNSNKINYHMKWWQNCASMKVGLF